MWKITLFIIASFCKFAGCSVYINSLNLSCEISLSNGYYDDFKLEIPKFHGCLSPYKDNKFKLTLKNYSMPAFPNGAFANFGYVHSFKLKIEENSELQLLFPNLPGFSLFSNSWFDSVVFYVNDLSEMVGWRWTGLFDLMIIEPGGFEFSAVRSKLLYLHSDFGRVANSRVIVVRILKCQLRWLGENVFAPLKFLKTLELRDNLLERIERSHLPVHAPDLKILDLGNNKLTSLPPDFAEGLNLEKMYLGGNYIKISESQARDILSSRGFPMLLGVLWPCLCEEFSNIQKIFQNYQEEKVCYKNDELIDINRFEKNCF